MELMKGAGVEFYNIDFSLQNQLRLAGASVPQSLQDQVPYDHCPYLWAPFTPEVFFGSLRPVGSVYSVSNYPLIVENL
jgi:hypothetical protein